MRRLLVLAIFVAVACLAVSMTTQAYGTASGGDYSVMPVPASDPSVTAKGYFVHRLQSDSSAQGAIVVRNTGNAPTTVVLAVSDAYTAQTGGSAFGPVGVKPTVVGTWVRLSRSSVTLAPGKQQTVRFSVGVPHDVRPGQYLAGIASYILSAAPRGSQRGSDQAAPGCRRGRSSPCRWTCRAGGPHRFPLPM